MLNHVGFNVQGKRKVPWLLRFRTVFKKINVWKNNSIYFGLHKTFFPSKWILHFETRKFKSRINDTFLKLSYLSSYKMTEEVCTWKNLKQTYICYIQFTTDTVKEGFKLFRKYHLHLHSKSKIRRNKKGDVQTLWQNVTSKVLANAVFILVANPLGVKENAQGMQPFTFMLTTSYPTSSSLPIPICRFFWSKC